MALMAQTPDTSATTTSAVTQKEVYDLREKVSTLEGKATSAEEAFLETKTTVDKLAKIKVGGYIQTQWQYGDSVGQATSGGGSFGPNSQERFLIRRARLKTTWQGSTSKYVLELDASPSGFSIKDINASISEPWLKAFTATAGVMDRPFGFEVGYSSSAIEVPERTRGAANLMPNEKDLGAQLEFVGNERLGFLEFFNLKAGVFTGMGATAAENDNEKDYIGRAGFLAPFYGLNLAVDGGFSTYMGKVTNTTTKVFETAMNADTLTWKAKSGQSKLDTYDRTLMGVDGQIYYDIPVIGGISLRGEYWWGKNPSSSSNSQFYAGDTNGVYLREVASWYVMAVQNLGTQFQVAARYDVYDPNTEADGDDIGKKGSKLIASDVAFSTVALALNYFWDDAVRFTAAYDIVTNEQVNSAATSTLKNWTKDLNDNLFTLRMQVKF